MKAYRILLICLFTTTLLNAQQLEVINAGGDYLKNNQGSITFSIGEVVIETFAHGNLCLTQGFCQSNVTVTAIHEIPDLEYELLAYPNPTKDFVTLKIKKDNLKNLRYLLYDPNGRLLKSEQIISNQTSIPFNFLIPATYYLKIIEKNTEIKTFKIIKSN